MHSEWRAQSRYQSVMPLGKKYYIPFFDLRNYFWEPLEETLQHKIPGRIIYCNVMIGAVLPWKPRIIRFQLQFCLGAVRELIAAM